MFFNVNFRNPHESQLSAMRCVTLNQIDPSYMICIRFFMVLCPHYEKARQNGENVNPFGAMASVAGDRSGPWTGWVVPAPV